jgi:hypothetical protein
MPQIPSVIGFGSIFWISHRTTREASIRFHLRDGSLFPGGIGGGKAEGRMQNAETGAGVHEVSPFFSGDQSNPAGLAAGSRWSARGKGADHRKNADKTSCTQKGCQNCCQPVFDLTRIGADSTSKRTVLASLQDARISSPRVRGSFPLLPRNDPRLPSANPAGLDWSAETNGKISRKPAPAFTNPSLMQP